MSMKSDATKPQVVALGMVSLVALAAGMVAPAKTRSAIIERLDREFTSAMQDPAAAEKLRAQTM